MAAFASFPTVPVSSTMQRPRLSYGSFVLNGASDPTLFAGAIESVVRLTNLTADPFFRVRLSHDLPRINGVRPLESFLQFTVHDPSAQTQLTAVEANQGTLPAVIRDDLREFDVTVIADGDLIVDTANLRVDFTMIFSGNPRK